MAALTAAASQQAQASESGPSGNSAELEDLQRKCQAVQEASAAKDKVITNLNAQLTELLEAQPGKTKKKRK